MSKGIGMVGGLGKAARWFDSTLTFDRRDEPHHYLQKNLKKGIDKLKSLWYNKNVVRGEAIPKGKTHESQ